MLLVGFEAEEEAPGVFLRLRKAHRKRGQRTYALATARHPRPGQGGRHAAARPRPAPRPSGWTRSPAGVGLDGDGAAAAEALRGDGAVILVGERLAAVPGALTAAVRLADRDRRPAGVDPAPGRRARRGRGRRAARRCCPAAVRSPTRRPATRSPRSGASPTLPHRFGRDTGQIVEAAADRRAGRAAGRRCRARRPARPGPGRARPWTAVGFLVSLELRPSEVTERADVVLPGRRGRREGRHLPQLGGPGPAVRGRAQARPDDHPHLAPRDAPGAAHARRRDGRPPRPARRPLPRARELDRLGAWTGAARADAAASPPGRCPAPGAGRGGARRPPAAARPGPAPGGRRRPSPAPGTRPSPGCPPPPPPRSASRTATPLAVTGPAGTDHAAAAGHRRCPTGWSGCR